MSKTEYTIFCIIPGGSPAFSVDIGKARTVDHLKDAIKKKKAQALNTIDADDLSLYQIDVDASDMKHAINVVKHIAQGLNNRNELNSVLPLEEVFSPSGPLRKRIHILVKLPASESINSSLRFQGTSFLYTSGDTAAVWETNLSPRLTTLPYSSLVCGQHLFMATGDVPPFLCSSVPTVRQYLPRPLPLTVSTRFCRP